MKKVKLAELAYARSGDKGDVSNIGLMAKTKNIYESRNPRADKSI